MLNRILILLAPLVLAACKHTLEIEGEGDIVELVNGERGCALDEYRAGFPRCTDNEVTDNERAVYRALPRPGWRFSHWDGVCEPESPVGDCEHNYDRKFIDGWDSKPRQNALPPLRAVFVQDGDTLGGAAYIASQFGGEGNSSHAALLDFLLTDAGYYRFTAQQAGTRNNFERRAADVQALGDGQLAVRNQNNSWISGGMIASDGRLAAVVDTVGSDLSVTLLQQKRTGSRDSDFQGSYYCGHISTRSPGYARYFSAQLNGAGGGSLRVISDRWQGSGNASLAYQVQDDGTTILDYLGLRLVGALSADGSVFTASEIASGGRGTAVCLRASSGKSLASVAGSYYGAWVQIQSPILTGVTDFAVNNRGDAGEVVLRDSLGDGNYSLDVGYVLVGFSGQLETRYRYGAISPNGRVMFLIETNPGASPNLALYIRKQ